MSSAHSTVFHLDLPPRPSEVHGSVQEDEDAVLGASQNFIEATSSDAKINEADSTSDRATRNEAEIEMSKPQVRTFSTKWMQYKEDMEQLNSAVQRAMTVAESEPKNALNTEITSAEVRAVTISVDGSETYRIPWKACRTWPCMDAFLREWFREDERALKCITDGEFSLRDTYGGAIHPKLWETVIMPDSYVEFSLQLSPQVGPAPAPHVPEIKSEPDTLFENRVQYKVSYYKRPEHGGRPQFVSESIYTEPIELEISNEHDKVPVLEERKQIESPPDPSGRNNDFGARRGNTKLHKLHQADVVSEPILKIYSPYLLNVLKSVIEYSAEPPMGDKEGLDAGVFAYPYKDLYHHLEDLRRYKTVESDLRRRHSAAFNQYADEHIDLLVSYLESQPTVQYEEAKARWNRSSPLTTFATFWLLMKPGTDVYVREADGSFNLYVLDRLVGGIEQDPLGNKTTSKYTAQLWNLALDDQSIQQYARIVDVDIFDDERKIIELSVFPARYHDECNPVSGRQAMIDRGQKYFEYSKRPCFLEYSGRGLKPGSRSYKRARVVVEHASRPWEDGSAWGPDVDHLIPAASSRVPERVPVPQFNNSFGRLPPPPPPPPIPIIGASIRVARCECNDCRAAAASQKIYPRLKFSEYSNIDPTKESRLTEHQYSILPSHMFAFVLNDRSYDLLNVATLQEPRMAETAIDRLVMRPENKGLIKAVATTYTDNSRLFSADFIYDKGEGQVILLHGPPGTGKTLTAESVAESTRRPLLNLTAADLGHEPDALEKSLLRYFRRANDWDAVVLLDEADVYLEKRSTNDLKRNSVVSVFLRALDYFQGILFLTTNRVGHFDEAFMSRIHLSLGYDKLNDDARAQIWGNMFQKLKDDHKSGGPKINYDYDAKHYVTKSDEVKALEWNGREIRNAFQTAVALAVYDSKHNNRSSEPAIPEVTEDHLRQVVSMSSAFRKYITAAHEGMDDSVLAYKYGNRDDGISTAPGR
ncbi:hypothetical protein M3J09_013467 [Ascochyta lentis]